MTPSQSSDALRALGERVRSHYAPSRETGFARLDLLPVDPWTLHAFWHVPMEQRGGPGRLPPPVTLEVTSDKDPTCTFEVIGQGWRNQRDISLPVRGQSWTVRLRVAGGEGPAPVVARAGPVRTARGETAERPAGWTGPPVAPHLSPTRAPAQTKRPSVQLDEDSFRKRYDFLLPSAWAGGQGRAVNLEVRRRWPEEAIEAAIGESLRERGIDVPPEVLLNPERAPAGSLLFASQVSGLSGGPLQFSDLLQAPQEPPSSYA